MRRTVGAMMIGVGFLLAAPARAAEAPPPEVMVADLLGWIDRNLAAGAEASTAPAPPPALGEGPVGRMVGWLAASPEAAPAPEVAASPEAAPPAVAPPAAVARPAVAAEPAPRDATPLSLTGGQAQPVARPGAGLLLPLN